MDRYFRLSLRLFLGAAILIAPMAVTPTYAAPRVELIIMDPGHDVFAAFGHAALRVTDGRFDRVYNFGATDFSDPAQLIWEFLRGKSRFYLSAGSFARTVKNYSVDNRSVFRLPLLLDGHQQKRLADMLAQAEKHNTPYVYDHFRRNCATELRDRIDSVVGGQLHRALLLGQTQFTFRDLAREGLSGHWPVQLFGEIILGREADRNVTAWDAGFLPRLLATNLRVGSRSLVGPVQVAHLGRRFVFDAEATLNSQRILWAVAGFFLLLAVGFFFAARRGRRRAGIILLLPIVVNGALGLLLWFVVAITTASIMRFNELALVFWPTDLLLLFVLLRRSRVVLGLGRWSRRYLLLRCYGLLAVVFGHLVGLLQQEPRVMILLALIPVLALSLLSRNPHE